MKSTLSILIMLALAGCSNNPGTTNRGGVPGNPVVTWNADPDSSRIDLGTEAGTTIHHSAKMEEKTGRYPSEPTSRMPLKEIG